jgi:tRNA dimethylallyltransferase
MAIALAKHYDSVILSADSRQFYKEMNIGTAKPGKAELAEVKHYFIDSRNIEDLYGAGHFEKDAIKLLDELFQENDVVFMTGGSGLYLNAIMNGVDQFEEVPAGIREALNKEFDEKGIDRLREKLKDLDPEYFEKVDQGNPQRMIRAIEVCIHTGKPYSSFLQKNIPKRNFICLPIVLERERKELYDKINSRVDEMMKEGLLEEVKGLQSHKNLNALKTVGYKELFEYLEGKVTLENAVDKIKQHTRNYAKRQMTWFKNQGDFEKFGADEKEKIVFYIDLIRSHG